MQFLVILLGLIVTATWLKDVDRLDDTWFARYQQAMRALGQRLKAGEAAQRRLGLILVYVGLLACSLLLEWLAAGALYGLATMALHLALLLFAMDRTQPGKLSREFLALWRAGDRGGCVEYLKRELSVEEPPSQEDGPAIVRLFKRLLAYRSFERMFMMYTLYVVAGPSGVVVGYVSYQLRAELCEEGEAEAAAWVSTLIAVLEWLPLRLLAVTFSLVGDFSQCFARLRQQVWQFDATSDNAGMLAGWASCALAEPAGAEGGPCESGDMAQCDEQAMALEVESLQGLLERSQMVWLVSVALLTLLGV